MIPLFQFWVVSGQKWPRRMLTFVKITLREHRAQNVRSLNRSTKFSFDLLSTNLQVSKTLEKTNAIYFIPMMKLVVFKRSKKAVVLGPCMATRFCKPNVMSRFKSSQSSLLQCALLNKLYWAIKRVVIKCLIVLADRNECIWLPVISLNKTVRHPNMATSISPRFNWHWSATGLFASVRRSVEGRL